MLFLKLHFGSISGVAQISSSIPQIQQYGERPSKKSLLVHAIPETDAFDPQLVRQLGLSFSRNALYLLFGRLFLRYPEYNIGLMPNNFILIQTGLTLKEIDKIGMSTSNFVTLLFLGFLALIPTFLKKKY